MPPKWHKKGGNGQQNRNGTFQASSPQQYGQQPQQNNYQNGYNNNNTNNQSTNYQGKKQYHTQGGGQQQSGGYQQNRNNYQQQGSSGGGYQQQNRNNYGNKPQAYQHRDPFQSSSTTMSSYAAPQQPQQQSYRAGFETSPPLAPSSFHPSTYEGSQYQPQQQQQQQQSTFATPPRQDPLNINFLQASTQPTTSWFDPPATTTMTSVYPSTTIPSYPIQQQQLPVAQVFPMQAPPVQQQEPVQRTPEGLAMAYATLLKEYLTNPVAWHFTSFKPGDLELTNSQNYNIFSNSDVSFEEQRFMYYNAEAQGQVPQFKQTVADLKKKHLAEYLTFINNPIAFLAKFQTMEMATPSTATPMNGTTPANVFPDSAPPVTATTTTTTAPPVSVKTPQSTGDQDPFDALFSEDKLHMQGQLTQDDIAAFRAATFTMGNIPVFAPINLMSMLR